MRWMINENTEVVIVGTYQGEASLKAGHYYMDPRNQFWTIMTRILQDYGKIRDKDNLAEMGPEKRERLLLSNRIGLGDVLSSVERKGSLDKNIVHKNHVDKKEILKKYPNVTFLPNGWTSYKWFVVEPEDEFIDQILPPAPSSSRANTHDDLDEKVRKWKLKLDWFLKEK